LKGTGLERQKDPRRERGKKGEEAVDDEKPFARNYFYDLRNLDHRGQEYHRALIN